MRIIQLVPAVALVLLAACQEPSGAPGKGIANGGAVSKSDIGTAVGVVGGTMIGWQFGSGGGQLLGAIGGGLLGGLLGDAVGEAMDEEDLAYYQQASQHAMRTGNTTQWQNTKTDHYGDIAPSAQFRAQDGRICRQYRQSIIVDGKLNEGNGTACREPDDSWHMVK
jgi:surface antigen